MRNRPIYHITHWENLAGMITAGRLWSDAQRRNRGFVCQNVGYNHIKDRRMRRPVTCHAGTTLGEYVPFNFCPRSVMLYVLHRGHQDYQGGQAPVVHLVSRVGMAIDAGQQWAFTDRHADLAYANYYSDLADEHQVDWGVMNQRMWGGDTEVKERRQAEFLVFDWFPWEAVEEIAVIDATVQRQVQSVLRAAPHRPAVQIRPNWYY